MGRLEAKRPWVLGGIFCGRTAGEVQWAMEMCDTELDGGASKWHGTRHVLAVALACVAPPSGCLECSARSMCTRCNY